MLPGIMLGKRSKNDLLYRCNFGLGRQLFPLHAGDEDGCVSVTRLVGGGNANVLRLVRPVRDRVISQNRILVSGVEDSGDCPAGRISTCCG